MATPRLFQMETSPTCARVFIVLDHKNIDHDVVSVDITQAERPAEFNRLSPLGQVPVWQDDHGVVCQSSVINEYLEEVYSEPAMLPRDPARRAYARQWIKYADSQLLDRNAQFVHVLRDIKAKQNMCRELFSMVPMLEREMAARSSVWFVDDELSLVDAALAPLIRALPMWAKILDDPIWGNCPALQAYLQQLEQHPSVQKRAFATPAEMLEGFYHAVLINGMCVP
jgi:glutathione S-transferase